MGVPTTRISTSTAAGSGPALAARLSTTITAPGHDIQSLCGRLDGRKHRPNCLRLVYDDSVQHPNRPGWEVYCVETGQTMQRELTVSVVIPAKNEARNLPSVLPQIPYENTQVVIVDGSSTDGTLEVARELRPHAVLVEQPARGKGYALAAGFEAATGDIIVSIDADGSMSPREIPALVNALVNGADFAKGSRSLGGSEDLTRIRDVGNQGLSWAFNAIHGTNHTDITYGYLAFWRSHLPALMPDCTGFEVEALLNVKAARAGLSVAEVPSWEGRRGYGQSNLRTIRDGLRFLRAYGGGGWGDVLRGMATSQSDKRNR